MIGQIHESAIVEDGVVLGEGTRIWDNVHVRAPSKIGSDCIIGEKSYVAYGVEIGDRVKINAFVYICTGVAIEVGAMIGAGVVFTNDRYPRATTPDLKELLPSGPTDATETNRVREGATIGARAVIGPGLVIGRFAMVGMGSVVTVNVDDYQLVAGSPARLIGFVCACGRPLDVEVVRGAAEDVDTTCSICGRQYQVKSNQPQQVG